MIPLPELLVVVCAALATSLGVVWWFGRPLPASAGINGLAPPDPIALLFKDEILQDATELAVSELSIEAGTQYWGDIREKLIARFPDFPDFPDCTGHGQIVLQSVSDTTPQTATIKWQGPLSWITISDTPDMKADQNRHDELATLRQINNAAPTPAWKETPEGTVIWFNQAYERMFQDIHGTAPTRNQRLFPRQQDATRARVPLASKDADMTDWFEVVATPTETATIFHAMCITAVVAAEETQRNFVQTLAKTFAHLSIGLAIFDRNQQLVLFNPALVDLTNLQGQFLSARPDLLSFFDQLREKRKMPEPKNYHSWREKIADVIAAASDGRYEETWSLETGQTYRVKGRPHPDGAIAFLIEDISAEITLTRSFRSELDQAHALLDNVPDAVAIFSITGVLTFSNAAFQALWKISPDTAFADMTLRDCATIWKRRARSGADIDAIDRLLSVKDPKEAREATLRLGDETVFQCQLQPAAAGGTMVRFRTSPDAVQNELDQARETAQ